MACCIRDADRSRIEDISLGVPWIERDPPQTLQLKNQWRWITICMNLDVYVEYHIKSSLSDAHNIYVSISTPILSQGTNRVSSVTIEIVEGICPGVVEIVEPPKDGYELTLLLKFANIPRPKDSTRTITDIAAIQSVFVISQLKQILRNFSSGGQSVLVYHPREPFYITKQELMDVGNSEEWAKAPRCTWSPIPPPELRG